MLEIKPVKSYEPPKIPTFDEDNSAMLKKLPNRWKRNAKVLACIGIMGTVTLASLVFPSANAQSLMENGEQSGHIAPISDGITVTLNGEAIEFDVPPMIVNDRTLVPFRAIFEALGMWVEWDGAMVYGISEDSVIVLWINSAIAAVNDRIVELETPPIIYNDRTMIPLQFIAEATGVTIEWDEGTRTVEITSENERRNINREISESDLSIRFHHGGANIPFYLVHMTEQETLGIIREQLENAGLNLGDTPFDYVADGFSIDLFDSELRVGVSQIDWRASEMSPFLWSGRVSDRVAAEFAEQTDIPIGVFYTPTKDLGRIWMLNWNGEATFGVMPTLEEIAEARTTLENDITNQVNEFIDFLRSEGIL